MDINIGGTIVDLNEIEEELEIAETIYGRDDKALIISTVQGLINKIREQEAVINDIRPPVGTMSKQISDEENKF